MADRNYSKDPVLIRDNKKLYGVIIAVVVVFLCIQVGIRFISGRHKKAESPQNLVEDKGRTVFKERDIAKSLEAFGQGARESAFRKLQVKSEKKTTHEPDKHSERLGPVNIIHHERKNRRAAHIRGKTHQPPGDRIKPSLVGSQSVDFGVVNAIHSCDDGTHDKVRRRGFGNRSG